MYPTRRGGRPSVRRGCLRRGAPGAAVRSALIVAAAVGLAACTTGPDPVASFVTEDGPQYFVRPVAFYGVGETEGSASVDVTVYETRGTAGTDGGAAGADTATADDDVDAGRSGGHSERGEADQAGQGTPPVLVNFTVPLEAARGMSHAELRTASGARYPLENLERFFARADSARYGSTLPREQFDRLRATPEGVELVIAAGDNGGGASAEARYASAEPWVRRIEILNLMLAD